MDLVEVFVALRNAQSFVSDAEKVSRSTKQIGTDAEETGKKAGSSWKSLAKFAATSAIMYGVARGITSAVSATTDLAKSTASLQRMTGMDTTTASEWVGVMHERGISSQQTAVAVKTLSKQMEVARLGTAAESGTVAKLRAQIDQVAAAGGKKAPAELAKLTNAIGKAQGAGEKARQTMLDLGVPLSDIQKGNTEGVLLHVADAFQKMHDPATKTADAVKLFGRSGATLLPILMQGATGIHKLLDQQKEWGNYLSGKNLADTKKLIAQQRELHAAWAGLKVQLGEALMPVLLSLAKVLLKVAKALEPLLKHPKVLTVLIIALTAAFVAYQVACIAATIASFGLDAAIFPIIGIVVLVIAVLALLAIGVYEVVKHWGWFEDKAKEVWNWIKATWPKVLGFLLVPVQQAVKGITIAWEAVKAKAIEVWDWIKTNWPLLVAILTGPFGVAALEVVKHWDAIKQAGGDAIHFIEGLITSLVKRIGDIPQALTSAIKKLPGGHAALSAAHTVGHIFAGQGGGIVPHTSPVLVGERGPEVVVLPKAAQVVPLQWGSQAPEAAGGGHHRPLTVEVPVYLDRQVLARAVAQVTADKMARR